MPLFLEPPITIEPRGLPRLVFKTCEDLRDWAQTETDRWGNWNQPFPDPLNSWRNEIVEPGRYLVRLMETAINHGDAMRGRKEAETQAEMYQSGPPIASDSIMGQRILKKVSGGRQVAAALDAGIRVNQRSFPIGVAGGGPIDFGELFNVFVELSALDEVQKIRGESEAVALDSLIRHMQTEFDETLREFL